ncbi:adenosylhomocysteine nucleosidase [Variovorax boronicumulans]|uniref:5'-methylthioadenosine/adenosylhomocysteine nucleosidase n=1 Tax=Variovorax boronicumulans TaxID=436515 RepID=UPI002781B71F|nr:5'-methylthioadenosine/adenosylhomocysteine nucleosidase [Variovorax boronicumulans]MDP9996218.1 adenosylhomocysteine nucleosidase [Variovorax boronicumulans]MDQ0007502.1 adenosylhomocysteine nucleosidase [Variovorax boronicumulans]MDQ0043035.1 adenosylhomocysteine nucleosidase [Variovorax boronicumulans]
MAAPIAIVAAMHEELKALLAQMPDEQRVRVAGRDFWVGHLQGQPVVAVLSRIGKVAAAVTATVLLERFGVRAIVFSGVAGGLAPGVNVGDVVVATELLQHDMDASPLFPKYEVPLMGISRFTADAVISDALAVVAEESLRDPVGLVGQEAADEFGLRSPKVHRGLLISGDRFVSTAAESEALRRHLPKALAVEMEGAAVAQVCHDYGVPFAAMRTISDRADDEAHGDFARFVAEVASRYSLALVGAWLAKLPAT